MSHARTRILFVTRDPVFHAQSGSTTYILQLLCLLAGQGAEVAVLCTGAVSRSPRLFFRQRVAAPRGVKLYYAGYLRLGSWYVRFWSPLAWLRLAARALARRSPARWAQFALRGVSRLGGNALFTDTWDLTSPTPREVTLLRRWAQRVGAETVIANYCFWGPVLRKVPVARTAILMHDLLSARVERFQSSGTPLDMPPITEAEEMQWLSGAGTVLAATEGEAARIRPLVSATVTTLPVVLEPRETSTQGVVEGRCLFVGSNIAPNQSALTFLLREVWPCVRASSPGAVLAVAGTVGRMLDGPEWSREELAGVQVLGVVPDLATEYERAAVCCVPLQLGTGIKIKLLEAMEHGKAIVSTRVGVEGLGPWVDDTIVVAETRLDFVQGLVSLLQCPQERQAREAAVRAAAREHFGLHRALNPAFRAALFGRAAPLDLEKAPDNLAMPDRELAMR